MAEWISIEQWTECASMERPGIVFEIRNAKGQSLFTACVPEVPNMPFDWTAPPLEFRPVPEPKVKHSTPIPVPKDPL